MIKRIYVIFHVKKYKSYLLIGNFYVRLHADITKNVFGISLGIK